MCSPSSSSIPHPLHRYFQLPNGAPSNLMSRVQRKVFGAANGKLCVFGGLQREMGAPSRTVALSGPLTASYSVLRLHTTYNNPRPLPILWAPIRANASLRPLSAALASLADKRHMLPISIERRRGFVSTYIKFYMHMHKVWHKASHKVLA